MLLDRPLVDYYDSLVLPALRLAAEDERRGTISRQRTAEMIRSILAVVGDWTSIATRSASQSRLTNAYTRRPEDSWRTWQDGRRSTMSWSRTKGLFVGVALEGATLREDLDDNAALYGKKPGNRAIVRGGVRAPKAAAKLLELLNRYSIRERTD